MRSRKIPSFSAVTSRLRVAFGLLLCLMLMVPFGFLQLLCMFFDRDGDD